ncbi:iron-containing alcohol dehydrogenase [Occultella glacieicola]|uniref:Iron-containing alcohol dehydrogenase n=1 Tax=Occultella glacieicola TaxID=2518684 RepID=A0ABY2E4N0_9MICO|nr:iron-containing alcohol dehydrogenase [Occultella glacieicola]TDE94985.1 iron-containing alcohol dehydrogenase [Occultella glacieicola]
MTHTRTPADGFGLLRLPNRIHFGNGAVAAIAPLALELGRRVFVCCDPFLADTPQFERTCEELRRTGAVLQVWTEVEPELPVDSVHRAADAASAWGPEVIIGFGGGSALDLAKLVALVRSHGGPLSDYYGENAVPGPLTPVIAVPTTAGTGSEVTPVAVVSDPGRDLKVGISSPHLIPRFAVVDPTLTRGAPATVTAHAGVDAFVHAIESYTAAVRTPEWAEQLPVFVGQNRLAGLLAEEAISVIAANLVRAVTDPDDDAARTEMAYGSLLAGMAFGSAGTHLSHAIQYPIGALTKTPHGLGTGLLLPHVLRGCRPDIDPALRRIATLLGVAETANDPALGAIDRIEQIVADIGIPGSLAELGVRAEDLPDIAARAASISRLAGNVAAAGPIDRIPGIVTAAWHGDHT